MGREPGLVGRGGDRYQTAYARWRQAEALTLLAGGQTNREIARELFITEKTASVHVSHTLSKLGVSNRAAAAAAAHSLGVQPPTIS